MLHTSEVSTLSNAWPVLKRAEGVLGLLTGCVQAFAENGIGLVLMCLEGRSSQSYAFCVAGARIWAAI